MGTDIHGIFQKFNSSNNQWEDIQSNYNFNRHYLLFAALADVRNGYGFAGIPTGTPLTPISEPRGLPEDFFMDKSVHPISSKEHLPGYMRNSEGYYVWMGDHSQSWLTGEEMLAWIKQPFRKQIIGVLCREVYENWDKQGSPEMWCGDISGAFIVKINDNQMEKMTFPNWTHIRCSWEINLNEELQYFFDEVQELTNKHGKIRFVFGFDS
jgi:hypothetical protein